MIEIKGALFNVAQAFQAVDNRYDPVVFEKQLSVTAVTGVIVLVSGIPDGFVELVGLVQIYQNDFQRFLLPGCAGNLYQWGDFIEESIDQMSQPKG
jgi:hypothetical protein